VHSSQTYSRICRHSSTHTAGEVFLIHPAFDPDEPDATPRIELSRPLIPAACPRNGPTENAGPTVPNLEKNLGHNACPNSMTTLPKREPLILLHHDICL